MPITIQTEQKTTIELYNEVKVDLVAFKKHSRETHNQTVKRLLQLANQLNKFEFEDVRRISKTHGFEIKIDDTIGNVNVYRAIKDKMRIDCTQNLSDDKIINLTIRNLFPNVDYNHYMKLKQLADDSKYSIILRPDGDLDTINILDTPEKYDLDIKKAFSLLKKAKKKISASLVMKLNNQKNFSNEIDLAIKALLQIG